MATGKNGYFDLAGSKGFTIRVKWSETWDVGTNTSNVSIDALYVKATQYWGTYYLNGTIKVNGVAAISMSSTMGTHAVRPTNSSGFFEVVANGSYDPAPWAVNNIAHNDDGSKKVTIAIDIGGYTITGDNGNGWKVSGSNTVVLTTIARASQPSLVTWPETTNDVGNFGDTISIHMNRKSDKFTHTVRWEFGDETGTIATGVTTGTTWTIPLDWMNQLPASTSGSGRIYVDTYNGSTKIGTKYTGFTAKVAASVRPTGSVQVLDDTDIQKTYGNLVRGLSKLYVKVTGYPAYGSPIAAYDVTANGVKYTEAEFVTGVLSNGGSVAVTAVVTDKRGRKSTAVAAGFQVLNYSQPKVTALTVHRCDADGTENDQGEFVKLTFSAAVTNLRSKNPATYVVKYKKSADSTFTEITLTDLQNKYSVTDYSYIFAADGNSSYDVKVSVADNHNTAVRATSVSTAFTLYNCHPSGTGWRFGGVAEKENTLQNDLSFCQTGNSYAFQPEAFGGAKGYTCLAQITLTTLNVNAPIVFVINRRGAVCPMTVYVRFASSSTTTDPDLGSFTYEGDNYGAFMVKTATSTWKLYVDNTGGWSNPCLQSWYTTENQKSRLTVIFPNEQVEGTAPNVLGTYYRAIPAVLRSILDFILPVGTIIHKYDQADPNDMYPGTTWVRMVNTFLWGCDADGDIGVTGGEKTHALTVNELPVHTHGSVYSGNVSATKTHAWLASGGSAMAYGAIEAGGGAAHNNMPPYTQVAFWRRTA